MHRLQARAIHADACVNTWPLGIKKLAHINTDFIYY